MLLLLFCRGGGGWAWGEEHGGWNPNKSDICLYIYGSMDLNSVTTGRQKVTFVC